MENDDGTRAWSNDLRIEPRRRHGRPMSRWLKEEGGGRGGINGGGRRTGDGEANSRESTVDPTRASSSQTQPNDNRHQQLLRPNHVPYVSIEELNLTNHDSK
ncbi:hypothetical protein TSUD_210710 [Trifolium subterraneum]|uniref:Uncharacterized protein n=1 Tax=Trifolium subterraneum TaxID=3900 RepID=A0A2Z6MF44_TRISU|nr:hypothetical protein TSUD_210710 [Trifolium subterraneum]